MMKPVSKALVAAALLCGLAARPAEALRASSTRVTRHARTATAPRAAVVALEVDENFRGKYDREVEGAISRLEPYQAERERYTAGWVPAAEKLNGRAAMMGFVILFLQEAVLDKGIFEFYGGLLGGS